eukprot:6103621-Amphidinium_carterae.1
MLKSLRQRWSVLASCSLGAVILVGFWLVYQCETCQVTNKRLYGYAKMYLMYQSGASATHCTKNGGHGKFRNLLLGGVSCRLPP